MKNYLNSFFISLLLMIIIGAVNSCDMAPAANNATNTTNNSANNDINFKITNVRWILEDIDPAFWSDSPPSSMFISFWIYYTGDNIISSSINYVKFTDPDGGAWYIDPIQTPYLFDYSNKVIGGWMGLYENDNSIPLGYYSFYVILADYKVQSSLCCVTAPGSKSTSGYNRVYSEENNCPQSGWVPMIKRATILSAKKFCKQDYVSVSFRVDDARIYSGFLIFCDSYGDCVGISEYFIRNNNTNMIVNCGSNFFVDNTVNSVLVSENQISYESGMAFSNIDRVIVNLIDGHQYSGSAYDCISRTSSFYLTNIISQ